MTDSNHAAFKFLLLFIMIIVNSAVVLVGKFNGNVSPEERYNVLHMLILTEILKLSLSCIAEVCSSTTPGSFLISISNGYLQMAVPAFLYLIQNSAIYLSLSYLSVPTFQVLSQSKLIITSFLSTLILNRSYNLQQWMGIFFVTAGVTVVVILTDETGNTKENIKSDTFFGVSLLAISCFCSGLAGVYFEALIKNINNPILSCITCGNNGYDIMVATVATNNTDKPTASLWARNIQLSCITLVLAFSQEIMRHFFDNYDTTSKKKIHHSFFWGFTPWVYLQILLLGGGGLLIAAVIKYADNVQKGLAAGVSVIISSVLSNLLFGTLPSIQFTLGASLVLVGLILFNNERCTFHLSAFTKKVIAIGTILLMSFSTLLANNYIVKTSEKETSLSLSEGINSILEQ